MGSAVQRVSCALRAAVIQDSPIYLAIAIYIAVATLTAYTTGFLDNFSFFIYPGLTLRALAILSGLSIAAYGFYLMLVVRPQRPIITLARGIGQCCKTSVFYRGLLLFPAITLFFSAISSFKTLILPSMAFSWDQRLIEIDKWLHGGVAPWRIIEPFVGGAFVTCALNVIYNLWFFIMFAALFWFMFLAKNEALRMRFFLAFILSWGINGSFLAMLFASSGPGFFHFLYPGQLNPYQGLMESLHAANQMYPVWALDTQKILWGIYQSGELGVGGGISAMPSMHVSIACLIFLVAKEYGRYPAFFGGLFLIIILLGSVRLAWHYAIDGYFSLVTSWVIWSLCRYIVNILGSVFGVGDSPRFSGQGSSSSESSSN